MPKPAASLDLATARAREAAHFLPVVNRMPVVLVEGRGSRVRDERGRELVDLTAGWGVTAIGHCHPALVEAIRDQAGRLMQTTNLFYTVPQLELFETFGRVLPRELQHSFIVSSGTEAMDGAIKLAHRATGRARFVSTTNSFHGRTIGALRVSGQAKHRDPYKGLLPPAHTVPFGDLDAARAAIDDETAAFVVEPIQGEGGVNVPPDGYLRGIREACTRHGAMFILDEIQTGIGRTGRMLALEHDGVMPDIVTLGKCLGGGFPVAAFLCTDAVTKTVQLGDHGGTYAGNPIACAAANAVIGVIEEEKLCARSADLGDRLLAKLRAFAAERADLCVEARGRGLLVGLELRDEKRAGTIPLRALEKSVLVNVTQGRVIRLFPALNVPEDELFTALDVVLGLVTEAS
jgi:acetylornithine/succinyldiaminopimelate/putrescine aminotransferase